MNKFIILAILFSSFFAQASQRGENGLRGPVPGTTVGLDTSVTSVSAGAWVTFFAALPYACSSIFVGNTGTGVMSIASGAAGFEVPQYVIPNQPWILPIELKKGTRLSLRLTAAGATTQAVGIVTFSCLQ